MIDVHALTLKDFFQFDEQKNGDSKNIIRALFDAWEESQKFPDELDAKHKTQLHALIEAVTRAANKHKSSELGMDILKKADKDGLIDHANGNPGERKLTQALCALFDKHSASIQRISAPYSDIQGQYENLDNLHHTLLKAEKEGGLGNLGYYAPQDIVKHVKYVRDLYNETRQAGKLTLQPFLTDVKKAVEKARKGPYAEDVRGMCQEIDICVKNITTKGQGK